MSAVSAAGIGRRPVCLQGPPGHGAPGLSCGFLQYRLCRARTFLICPEGRETCTELSDHFLERATWVIQNLARGDYNRVDILGHTDDQAFKEGAVCNGARNNEELSALRALRYRQLLIDAIGVLAPTSTDARLLLRALRRRAARVGGAQPFPSANSAAELSLVRLNVMTHTSRTRLSVYFGEARSGTSVNVGRRTGAVHLYLRPASTDLKAMRRWFHLEDCPRSQSADLTGATTSIVLALQPEAARDEGGRKKIRDTAEALASVFAPEAEHQAQPRTARGDVELFVLLIDDSGSRRRGFSPRGRASRAPRRQSRRARRPRLGPRPPG